MKLAITIEYNGGSIETYVAQPPEWAKWESKTGFTIQQAQDKIGISDLMFLAYHAMKRNEAGKPVKPFEVWMETVVDVTTGDNDPKATSAEA
jgi:hypothetical protein